MGNDHGRIAPAVLVFSIYFIRRNTMNCAKKAATILLVASGMAYSSPGHSETFFAVVNANATLARGHGVVGVQRNPGADAGAYLVAFSQDISNCAFVATIGVSDNSGISQVGIVSVLTSNSNRAAFVQTRDRTGVSIVDRPFHLIVTCP